MLAARRERSAQAPLDRLRAHLAELRRKRVTERTRHPIVLWQGSPGDPRCVLVPPPASIVIHCAAASRGELDALGHAYRGRDFRQLEHLAARRPRLDPRRLPASPEVTIADIEQRPQFFDLHLNDEVIAEGLWAPDAAYWTLVLPLPAFAGAAPELVVTSHRTHTSSAASPAILAVVRPPELSEIESVATQSVPPDVDWLPTAGDPVPDNIALLGIVTVCILLTTEAFGYAGLTDALASAPLPTELVAQIDRTTSLADLLEIRAKTSDAVGAH